MRSQIKRLALAAALSATCAAGTIAWYKLTEKSYHSSNEAPLAQVSRVGDEVLRRPPTRLLWQAVNTGDNLYNGETVRTSAHGEMRIQFDDGRYIDLEPDSLVVLQKSKGEISLDLMEGSLFVNAKSEGTAGTSPGLVLNSKGSKVDLTGASASLSRGSGDRLDVQVLEGKATIQGKDGKANEIGTGKTSSLGENGFQFDNSNWKITSPKPGAPVYIDPSAEKPLVVRWQGLPTNWAVSLMAGNTRKDLKEVARVEKPGDLTMATKLALGKYWWRLVAKDPATNKVMAESAMNRMELLGRYAPAMIFPVADSEIPVDRSPFDLTFKWQTTEQTTRVQLEVSTEENLKNPLLTKTFTSEDQVTLPRLKNGTYYWRISSYYEGSEKPILGKIQHFSLVKPQHKDPAQIVWTLPEAKLTQPFVTQPLIELTWEAKTRKEDIVNFRVKLENETDLSAEPQKVEAKESFVKTAVPKAGRYIASIEAYDKEGSLIGRSEKRTITSAELPPLPAPILQPAEGILQSGFDGRTELRWTEVNGAKEYQLTITDKAGKELAKKKYSANSASLKNLMPGEYSVKVEALDAYGRNSPEVPTRILAVPDKSNLKAPTLKKIKVN